MQEMQRSSITSPVNGIAHAHRDMVETELQDAEEWHHLTSEWALPMVLVEKKDRILRLCVDYTRMNVTEAYPLPHIDNIID